MHPNSNSSGSCERQRAADHVSPIRSCERQRVARGHLPRLAPEWYRGRAFVHWTLTLEARATGWLTREFHHAWELTLLHACSRWALACPAYVLMPDHIHLLWLGLSDPNSDQRSAIEFLRRRLRSRLAPADWQRQAHDQVLDGREREHGAFQSVAHYVLENPVRAGLVIRWVEYAYTGCCVPGYPELDVRAGDYWERFWRYYNYRVTQGGT